MAKAVTIIGWILLIAGAGFVVLGLAGIAMSEGVWAALQTLNPFNIANFLVTVLTLAPGILLVTWGNKLKEK